MAAIGRGMSRRFGALAVVLAVISMGDRARAAPPLPVPSNAERAEARFREGSRAFDDGHVDQACAAFDESLRLLPTLGTLLNLALCHERQGKNATAWLEFTHAAAWATDPARRDRHDFAHQHALRLERSLSPLRIEPTGEDPIHLEIDGESVPETRRALPMFLDAGPHVVTAIAPARKRYQTTVFVPAAAASDPLVVSIPALQAEASERPAAPRRPEGAAESSSSRRTAGWIVGGAGIVFLGAGAYLGFDSLSKLGACPATCDSGSATTSEILSLVAFGAGVSALAAGTWLILSPSATPASRSARLYVAPSPTGRSGGLVVVGTW